MQEKRAENNGFLFKLKEEVWVDDIGTAGTIMARCETLDIETDEPVSFYLITDGEESWEITEDALKAYNLLNCKHAWSFYEADKSLNICVRCGKKKAVNELQ